MKKSDAFTVAKREVRDRLYEDVRGLKLKGSRFGMFSGGTPSHEVSAIRLRFFRPEIRAYALEKESFEAAVACRVSSVLGDVRLSNETFDFFNADFYNHISSNIETIQNIALRCSSAISVFASYGLGGDEHKIVKAIKEKETVAVERVKKCELTISSERVSMSDSPIVPERASRRESPMAPEHVMSKERPTGCERVDVVESTKVYERVSPAESSIIAERVIALDQSKSMERAIAYESPKAEEQLPVAQLGRILLLKRIITCVRPEAKLVRVYQYRGNNMPMIGALFAFTKSKVKELTPFVVSKQGNTNERRIRLLRVGATGKE